MRHADWFRQAAGGDSVNAAAGKAELPQPSLARHVRESQIPAESVIKLCRAYRVNPAQGLVDTGYLHAEETGHGVTIIALTDATDREVIAEMLRRIDTGKDLAELWNQPLGEQGITNITSKED